MSFNPNLPISLINSPSTYKPFHYPWAFDAWEKQQRMHWLPSEVPMSDDIRDWKFKLNDKEKHLIEQIFKFFTQADIEVNDCYMSKYSQVFQPTEIRMMLSAFSAMETIHVQAYSHLLETLGLPDSTYSAFLEYKAMKDKYDYLHSFNVDNPHNIAKTLAAFGAFTEGMQLFASFVILLNFTRFNKMKGMGTIISWSIRDENLHCDSIIRLFNTFIDENPKVWTKELKNEIYDIAKVMVDCEDKFIDLAFEFGDVEGLTAKEVKEYIRYITDRRLIQLRMKPYFKVKINPISEWLDPILNAPSFSNFFDTTVTDYSKSATTGTWDSAFNKFDSYIRSNQS